ncbi:hypothetical protein OIU78_012487 [Salix suchowensis]|nr:hypothetical protein OIU78_012487 [Salix suchowensis]
MTIHCIGLILSKKYSMLHKTIYCKSEGNRVFTISTTEIIKFEPIHYSKSSSFPTINIQYIISTYNISTKIITSEIIIHCKTPKIESTKTEFKRRFIITNLISHLTVEARPLTAPS